MHSPFYRRSFVVATILLLACALIRLLQPLWFALGWAALLAFLLYPLHERLTRRLKGRAGMSAGIITGLTPFLIVTPLAVLGMAFAQQIHPIVERLREIDIGPFDDLAARLARYRYVHPIAVWVRENLAITTDQVQQWLVDSAQGVVRQVVTNGGNVVLGVVGTLVGIFLMQFLLFFLLRDGHAGFERLCRLVPLEPERGDPLVERLAGVVRAVVYGTVVTALLQGALVGVGFALVQLPSPIVFGVLGAVAAFIPAGGTGLVLVPAVIYLFASGRPGPAIFLALWSAVVGVADNFLRPLLASRYAPVQTWAVFVGVVGGISMFGALGLVLGPVLLSLIVELVELAEEAVSRRG